MLLKVRVCWSGWEWRLDHGGCYTCMACYTDLYVSTILDV